MTRFAKSVSPWSGQQCGAKVEGMSAETNEGFLPASREGLAIHSTAMEAKDETDSYPDLPDAGFVYESWLSCEWGSPVPPCCDWVTSMLPQGHCEFSDCKIREGE